MNSEQMGGIIRAAMNIVSGIAIAYGIGNSELWLSITSGAVSLAVIVWSIWSNSTPKMIQTVAERPEVAKVVTKEPGFAISIPSDKVVAR